MKKNAGSEKKISRRKFLGISWLVSSFALLGQSAWAFIEFLKPLLKGSFGSKIVAGDLEIFKPNSVTYIQSGRFYISALEDGGLLALWQTCPHLGCSIPWKEAEGIFLCPCHSSIFTRVGEVTSGPAPRPMDRFLIEIVDDQVVVNTSTTIQRKKHDPSEVFYS